MNNLSPDGCLDVDCTNSMPPKAGDVLEIPGGRVVEVLEIKTLSSSRQMGGAPGWRVTHRLWYAVNGFRK